MHLIFYFIGEVRDELDSAIILNLQDKPFVIGRGKILARTYGEECIMPCFSAARMF